MKLNHEDGRIDKARWLPSPNQDDREHHASPEVVIIHSISLPPGEYENGGVEDFFCNQLDHSKHTYFDGIKGVHVSAHFFISRSGDLTQFVSTQRRAWHAGESVCLGKPKVNDFSIGIELEGLDEGDDGYTDMQYSRLNELLDALEEAYPSLSRERVFAHSDIAPDRKLDPGPYFEWSKILIRK